MQDPVKSIDEQARLPRQLSDFDGKIYDQLATGQVVRRSPKLRGKDRRLARQMVQMMEAQDAS